MSLTQFRMMVWPLVAWLASATLMPMQQEPRLSEEEMKMFLLTARVVNDKSTSGISFFRLTLSDGNITHDAAFHKVNAYNHSYRYDIAAYELCKLLGLGDMMPVTVERRWRGDVGAISWWLPIMMDEAERLRKSIKPPDIDAWQKQMYKKMIFTELVYDTTPNLSNTLISEDWHLWMIDFSRGFRLYKDLRAPRNIAESRCPRQLFENLRGLSRDKLTERTRRFLNKREIDALMARRDRIVAIYEDLIRKKGGQEVLYDDPAVTRSSPAAQGIKI